MSIIPAAIAGAASWSAAEYGLHRFAMHELQGRGLASREHLQHHADVTYFTSNAKKLLSASVTGAAVLPVSWRLVGRRDAIAYTSGMIAMYFAYEVTHRRIHTHPPINRYGRWLRRSHFHHHFGKPRRNFGVTSPLFDHVFRTYDEPGVVTMPRRMAPDWLLDEHGEVKPGFAADYRVKGRRDASTADTNRDHDDAFSNRPPSVEAPTADADDSEATSAPAEVTDARTASPTAAA